MLERITSSLASVAKEHTRRKREEDKLKYGCVIRALESVTGVLATEEEWDARLEQRKEALQQLKYNLAGGENEDVDIDTLENENLGRLITEFRHHETPMGQALKGFRVKYLHLSQAEVLTHLSQGDSLILLGQDEGRGHALHVVLDPNGQLISQSDAPHQTVTVRNRAYGYVFSKKRHP